MDCASSLFTPESDSKNVLWINATKNTKKSSKTNKKMWSCNTELRVLESCLLFWGIHRSKINVLYFLFILGFDQVRKIHRNLFLGGNVPWIKEFRKDVISSPKSTTVIEVYSASLCKLSKQLIRLNNTGNTYFLGS